MRILLSLFILFSLASCSFFTEREIKNTALTFLNKEYEEIYRAELRSAVGDNHHRGDDFVGYMLRHTKISAGSVTKDSDEAYRVEMNISSPTAEARTYVLEKMKPLTEEHDANNFNFGDCIIAYQKKFDKQDVEPSHKTMISVRKINEAWVAK